MELTCPYCGTDNTFDDSLYGQDIICGACGKVFVAKSDAEADTMSTSVRKGMTDAKFNEEAFRILFVEIVFLSIVAGVATSSWWCFGGVLLGLLIVINIPQLVEYICWIAVVAWGSFGFWIGKNLFEDIGAAVVLFAILGLGSYALHKAGIQHVNDVGTS